MATQIISENLQIKKRGRPRKNIIDQNNKNSDMKKNNFKQLPKEIILHLAVDTSDDLQQKNTETDINNTNENIPNNKIEEEELKSEFFAYGNINNEDSDNSDEISEGLIKKLKNDLIEKDRIIKKLKTELQEFRSDTDCTSQNKENSIHLLNLNLIDCKNGKNIVIEKTDICCWWCTYEFDNLPFFIPENENNGTFYVFGCFCSPQCAAAYNDSLNDYKTRERYSLIKKLNAILFGSDKEIINAPAREILVKFGGYKSIEEYRKASILNNKDIIIRMPPLVPIIPFVEEKFKDKILAKFDSDSNTKQVMIKPIINQKKTLLDIMGISK